MLIQVDGFALWLHFELDATANLQVVEQIKVTTFQKLTLKTGCTWQALTWQCYMNIECNAQVEEAIGIDKFGDN